MSRTLTPSYYFYGRPDPGELRINRPPAEVQYGGFHTHVIISSHPLLAARIFPLPFSFCLDLAHEIFGRAARPHHLSLFPFPLSLFVWILPHEPFPASKRGGREAWRSDGVPGAMASPAAGDPRASSSGASSVRGSAARTPGACRWHR